MVNVSDEALQFLANLLEENESPEGTVARCAVSEGALLLVPDSEREGDEVFKHEDRPVLVVQAELAEALDGRELHVETTEEGTNITIREAAA